MTFSSRRFAFILIFFDSQLSPIVTNGDTNLSLLGIFRDAFYHFIQRSDSHHHRIGSRQLNLYAFIRHFSHHVESDLTLVITNGDTNLYLLGVFCDACIASSSVQIFIIAKLHLASYSLVVSSSAFHIIVNVVLLVSITNLIPTFHSLVCFSSLLVAATGSSIPAATAFWPASWIFGVDHHPTAATPSSCNSLMKPKFDRLILFLGVSFNFFHCSCRSHRRAHPQLFGVFFRTLRTPPERHPS